MHRYFNSSSSRSKDPLYVLPEKVTRQIGPTCVAHAGLCMVEGHLNFVLEERLNISLSSIFSILKVQDVPRKEGDKGIPPHLFFAAFPQGVTIHAGTKEERTKKYRIAHDRYHKNGEIWETTGKTIDCQGIKDEIGRNGPLMVLFRFDDYFMKHWSEKARNGEVYQLSLPVYEKGSNQFKHVVAVIGYNKEKDIFLAQNSWGDEWGEEGTFTLASSVFDEIYIPRYMTEDKLKYWLKEDRNQFLISRGAAHVVEVFWNVNGVDDRVDPLREKSLFKIHFGLNLNYIRWSPFGTYLATCENDRVLIWAGDKFSRLMQYDHLQVSWFEFSHEEKYVVTYSPGQPITATIFDVETGQVKMTSKADLQVSWFEFSPGEKYVVTYSPGQPITATIFDVETGQVKMTSKAYGISYKWSGGKEDKYFAFLSEDNEMSVFDDFIKIEPAFYFGSWEESVTRFCWSPTDPILALFIPSGDHGLNYDTIRLINVKLKQSLQQIQLRDVSDWYWQSKGDYLAIVKNYVVDVDGGIRKRKTTHSKFWIFCLRKEGVPWLIGDFNKIVDFAWEPNGHRFAVRHGVNSKPDVTFCSIETNRDAFTKDVTLKNKPSKFLLWSPAGKKIILAGPNSVKTTNIPLEKMAVYDVEKERSVRVIHPEATNVNWDPTGSSISTTVMSTNDEKKKGVWSGELKPLFKMWSSNGKLLYMSNEVCIHEFLWRPRPHV